MGQPITVREFKDRAAKVLEDGMAQAFSCMEVTMDGELCDNHRKIRDGQEMIGLPWNCQLFRAAEDGAKVRVTGRPQVSISKSGAAFVNILPLEFEYLGEKERSPSEAASDVMASANSFNTRPFPDNPRKIAVIHPWGASSPVLKDLLGECDFGDIEVVRLAAEISNSAAVVEKIAEAADCDILVIIQGGMDVGTFSHPDVLRALNETPPKQYRLLAIGHSTSLPAAYFFSDGKAQTPSSGGVLLNQLLKNARTAGSGVLERERARHRTALEEKNKEIITLRASENALKLESAQARETVANVLKENEDLTKKIAEKNIHIERSADFINGKWSLAFVTLIGGIMAGWILSLLIAR